MANAHETELERLTTHFGRTTAVEILSAATTLSRSTGAPFSEVVYHLEQVLIHEGGPLGDQLTRAAERACLLGTDTVDAMRATLSAYLDKDRQRLRVGGDGIAVADDPWLLDRAKYESRATPMGIEEAPQSQYPTKDKSAYIWAVDGGVNMNPETYNDYPRYRHDETPTDDVVLRQMPGHELVAPWPLKRGNPLHWRIVQVDHGMVIVYGSDNADNAVAEWHHLADMNQGRILLVPPSTRSLDHYDCSHLPGLDDGAFRNVYGRLGSKRVRLAFAPLKGMSIHMHLAGVSLMFQQHHPLWPLAEWWIKERLVNPANYSGIAYTFGSNIPARQQENIGYLYSVFENHCRIIYAAEVADDICQWFLRQLYRGHSSPESMATQLYIFPPQGQAEQRAAWDLLEL